MEKITKKDILKKNIMCLETKKKKVSIAKRDIIVFKSVIGKNNGDNTWRGPFFSEVSFPLNEVVTAKDYFSKDIDHLVLDQHGENAKLSCIYRGFHSRRFLWCLRSDNICIIPKGSEYCRGLNGEVVSKEIIVFSSYKEYFRYKWKKLLEKIS